MVLTLKLTIEHCMVKYSYISDVSGGILQSSQSKKEFMQWNFGKVI